jgi:hypothetical protein
LGASHCAPSRAHIIPARPFPNLAAGKRCLQSSVDNSCEADAAGAVDGYHTGEFGFHTNYEDRPWWSVDLEATSSLSQIRIYNRLGAAEIESRFDDFAVLVSDDGENWRAVYEHPKGQRVGGIDGYPLIIDLAVPVIARLVKIMSNKPTFLHLDKVEVLGEIAS